MFSCNHYQFLFYFIVTFIARSCISSSALILYSPGEPEYAEVVVRRVGDNLTLLCEVRGDTTARVYVWNYVGQNASQDHSPFTTEPAGPAASSSLFIPDLALTDSGHYMCSAPPFSLTKYVIVQNRGDKCGRGALSCGLRCVPALYVCDGRADCLHAEDERGAHCPDPPCLRSDKLNCSSGRCISMSMCCGGGALCRQPSCCGERDLYNKGEGYLDVEYPALFEDRHAPDDYGFIQSTIYTVTACALIFMIAVVLLVSAICKMHMKRAALRNYTHADRTLHYTPRSQTHRFPPCYETSRLLEQARHGALDNADSQANQAPTATVESPTVDDLDTGETVSEESNAFRLNRLSSIFNARYRQVPTRDVEMTHVRSTSLNNSPTRNRTRTPLDNYRSPTYCDLNTEFYFTNPETSDYGRDLNYMSTPMEFFRRRTLRPSGFDRVLQQINQPRPLTLQLGRFQLSIPRFGRRNSAEQRPDTPNVAEINIDDLDFVRLNSGETYTLNGRTIRLLGGNFENYPVLPVDQSSANPPAYNDAMRYKLYGPPPEYLSRDCLNDSGVSNSVSVDEEARSNVEMPPRYDELGDRAVDNNNTVNATSNVSNDSNVSNTSNVSNAGNASNVSNTGNVSNASNVSNTGNVSNATAVNDNGNGIRVGSDVTNTSNNNNDVIETIDSVIDNLPAIDSDVNANEAIEC